MSPSPIPARVSAIPDPSPRQTSARSWMSRPPSLPLLPLTLAVTLTLLGLESARATAAEALDSDGGTVSPAPGGVDGGTGDAPPAEATSPVSTSTSSPDGVPPAVGPGAPASPRPPAALEPGAPSTAAAPSPAPPVAIPVPSAEPSGPASPGLPETPGVLESVVVTAERRATNLQSTPIAITDFSPGVLQDRGIGSIRDLAGQVPNLSVARANISYTTQTYSLRGVGETDPIQEPVLAIYIDDVYQPRQIGSMLDFNDIERVEVLRGLQGTLYGRNSSAGALRVITADPGNQVRTEDSLTFGNFRAVKALASVRTPIIADRLAASLSFLHNQRDGITFDPTQNRDMNRIDVDAARAKLHFTPDDRWDLLLTLNGMVDRSDSRSYVPAAQPGVTGSCAPLAAWRCPGFATNRSYSEVPPYQHLDQLSSSLRTLYSITDQLELKLITAGGGFNLNPVYYDNDGVAALIQKNLIHYDDGYFTQEVQLNGKYQLVSFTSGLFYLRERFFVNRDGYSRRNAMPTDPAINPENYAFLRAHNITNTNSIAIFGEGNLELAPWATLTAGLRETLERKAFSFNNAVLDASGGFVSPSIHGDADHLWSAVTPKASLALHWPPVALAYFTYSRGFKSGGFDNRATNLTLAERPFNPEYVNNFEVGFKTELFEHRFRANTAAFYNAYRDLQVSYTDPAYPGNSIRGNAGKAHTEGVEIEVGARVLPDWSLQASGAYLRALYDTYKNAGGPGVDADGHPLPNAPRWNFSAGTTIRLPFDDLPGAVRLAADLEYASSAFSSALARPQDEYPAQTFLNGTLSWTSPSDHLVVILSSRNLLDSQKPVSASYTPSTGVLFYNFPDPRTVLATLKYRL